MFQASAGQSRSGNLLEFSVGYFRKKRNSFAFSVVHFYKYHPGFLKIKMNIQSLNPAKSDFINPKNDLRTGHLQHPPSLNLDGTRPLSARKRQTSKLLFALILAASILGVPCLATAQLANLNPIKDNTLYQYVPEDGDLSNALGTHFFAGETGMGELRRGVLAFDIAGNIPAGSTILTVSLSLNVSRTGLNDARIIELRRMLADWGEGTSQASGDEGMGAPATTDDATWRHRFFDTIFWTTEGGDFSATVSASQSVGPIGVYTWSSTQMRADVQSWLDNPGSNFGWIVLGDESQILTAKRFDTRESASPPVLTILYRPAGPRPTPTPRPRPTPLPRFAFSQPLLFLLRLFALLPAPQSA